MSVSLGGIYSERSSDTNVTFIELLHYISKKHTTSTLDDVIRRTVLRITTWVIRSTVL